MARPSPIETEYLIARLGKCHQSYCLSFPLPGNRLADDEGVLDFECRITSISPRHRRFLDQPLNLMLVSARRYGDNEPEILLGSVTLKKNQQSSLVYLPQRVFYALPNMLGPHSCSVDLQFEALRWGHGSVHSISLATADQLIAWRSLSQLGR